MIGGGGPLEAGVDRTVAGGAVLAFAPMLLLANFPVPAIAGVAIAGMGLGYMLRASVTVEHRVLMYRVCAALGAFVALQVAAMTAGGIAGAVCTVGALGAWAGAFALHGYAMRELCRGLGHRGLGHRWKVATMPIVVGAAVVTVAGALALAAGGVKITSHHYVFVHGNATGVAFACCCAAFVVLLARLATLVAHTRYTLRVHLENEPLRRMRTVH